MSDRWTIGPLSFETIEDDQQPIPVVSRALSMRIDRKSDTFERIEVDITGFDMQLRGDLLILIPKPPEPEARIDAQPADSIARP